MSSWKIYALLAALCNASVGVFSKTIFQMGLSSKQVAFYKCLIAFLILSFYFLCKKEGFSNVFKLKKDFLKIAACAVFGIFTLYYFETAAYTYANISTVVFILLGSSGVATFVLSKVLLKERLSILNLISMSVALIGLFFMLHQQRLNTNVYGVFFALIAGVGYGAFLTLTKKFKVNNSGFEFMWWFIAFGSFYLSIPFLIEDPVLPSLQEIVKLALLSLIPTIGGFYCTIKALSTGKASGVQLFELSEPVFASLFAFISFNEMLSGQQFLGALLILFAIYLSSLKDRFTSVLV